jgi:hypothetical protein
MFREVLSINTFSASRDNFCVSIELTTMKRKATMKMMFSVLCGLGCWWFGGGTVAMAGDGAVTNAGRFKELDATLRQTQDQIHRQVFSTAPPKGALAEIQDRLPEIQKAAGVSALTSKWDEPALKTYSRAEQVDVTDQLVREFKSTEQQLKVIADLQKQKPVSLEECDELIRKGKI